MALKSRLLAGDAQLEACLVRDSAHVKKGASGAHVAKIQQALAALDGALIDRTEIKDRRYGISTAAAVQKYKGPRGIINTTYETTADDIVGKMTIARLDSDMVAREAGRAPPAPAKLTAVPFTEAAPFLISKRDHSPTKGDLRSTPTVTTGFSLTRKARIALARTETTKQLQGDMAVELFLGGAAGTEAASDFFKNLRAGATITKGVSSVVSGLVKASPEFRKANADVKVFVTDALSISALTGVVDYHVLAEPGGKVPPPGLSFGGFQQLHVIIGSFQGVKISLQNFNADPVKRRYTADLVYEWFDHFGVDDSDLDFDGRGHGTPGQVALWVLQRERPPGNRPYVLRVFVTEIISDAF